MDAGPTTPELRIIDDNDQFVVLVKPPGLLSVPGRGEDKQDCVASRIQALYPLATGSITVHRLDFDTSGVMVYALNPSAHRALSRQFMHRKVGKSYDALLAGDLQGDEGEVDLPLIVDWPNRPRQMVCYDHGKPAKTLWRVTDRTQGRTRVEFRPVTGRTHQLRVHAVTPTEKGGMGAPILGDPLYGDPTAHPRMCLHAKMLSFWHPTTGKWVVYEQDAEF